MGDFHEQNARKYRQKVLLARNKHLDVGAGSKLDFLPEQN
jgi:hypothetical protein